MPVEATHGILKLDAHAATYSAAVAEAKKIAKRLAGDDHEVLLIDVEAEVQTRTAQRMGGGELPIEERVSGMFTFAVRERQPLGRLRRNNYGVLETLVSTGNGYEVWEPAATRYAHHRILDMDAALSLHEELERAGWTPPPST